VQGCLSAVGEPCDKKIPKCGFIIFGLSKLQYSYNKNNTKKIKKTCDNNALHILGHIL
jgi:hypothetical protein